MPNNDTPDRELESLVQALASARESSDRQEECSALIRLGVACVYRSAYDQAIEHFRLALVIAREMGNRRGEGRILADLGRVYAVLAEYARAVEYYELALVIAREMKDRRGEGRILADLGHAYTGLVEYARATECYQTALAIARQIDDMEGENAVLNELGGVYVALEQHSRAIGYFEEALAIARRLGNQRKQGYTLINLGETYAALGEYAHATEHFQSALAMARQIGDSYAENVALANLEKIYPHRPAEEESADVVAQPRAEEEAYRRAPSPETPPRSVVEPVPAAEFAGPVGAPDVPSPEPLPAVDETRFRSKTATRGAYDSSSDMLEKSPHFSAFYPETVQPGLPYALIAFVHLESALDRVREIAAGYAGIMGGQPASGTAQSAVRVDPGSLITFVPQVAGLRFDPAEQVIPWQPPYQSATFLFTAPATLSADLAGRVLVYQGPLILGEIPVRMARRAALGPDSTALTSEAALQHFDPVFASYSHHDTPVMQYFRRARERLGQRMLVDIYDLRAGEHWADRLLEMIDQSAVFQLFWSQHSAQSSYCRQEWQYALGYLDRRPRFVQPVWWQAPMPPPPPELASLHFQRVALPPATRAQLAVARLRRFFRPG